MYQTNNVSIVEALYASLLISLCLFVMIGSSMWAPYNIEDEKELVLIGQSEIGFLNIYEDPADYSQPLKYLEKYRRHLRFKPVSLLLPWTIAKWSNGDPLAIRLYVFLFSCLTLILFYLFLRALKITWYQAGLGVLLLFSGHFDEIWWRWGPSELPGLLFFILAFFLLVVSINKKKATLAWLSLIALIASALSKESFLILMPAVSAFYIFLYASINKLSLKESFLKTKYWHLVSTVFFLFFVAVIIYMWLGQDGTYKSDTTYSRITILLNNLIQLNNDFFLWLPVLFLLGYSFIKRYRLKMIWPILFVGVYWIASQLLIHKDIFMLPSTRYLIPGQLIFIFLTIFSLNIMRELKMKKVTIILSIILTLWGIYHAKNVAINSSYFSNRAIAYHNMLQAVVDKRPHGIAVVLEQGSYHEFTFSTAVYLSALGQDIPVKYAYLDVQNKADSSKYDKYKASFKDNAVNTTSLFEEVEIQSLASNESIDLVILADPDGLIGHELNFLQEGFSEMHSFSRPYFHFAIRPLLKGKWDEAFDRNHQIRYLIFKK